MKGASRVLAYFGAGVLFFVFFLFWTFPYDVLKSRILNQIEDGLGGQYRIKVQKMSGGLLFGLAFKNVEVVKKEGGKDLLLFKTARLRLRPSWIGLLRKNTSVSFDVKTSKGGLDGKFVDSADQTRVQLELDEVPLGDFRFLSALYGVNLKGTLDGDADLKINKKDVAKNAGQVEVDLINLTLDPMKVRLDPNAPESTMDLPKITLTGAKNSKLLGTLTKTDFDVKEFTLKGGDLDLSLKGPINLGPRFEDHRVNLSGRLSLSPALAQAIPVLSLFEQQKLPDGSFDLQVGGRLAKPSITVGRFKLPF